MLLNVLNNDLGNYVADFGVRQFWFSDLGILGWILNDLGIILLQCINKILRSVETNKKPTQKNNNKLHNID